MNSRQVIEGTQPQGRREKVYYSLTTTPWGSTPANVVVKVEDVTNANADVTATVTSGAAEVVGDVITLPKIQSLTEGHVYWVGVQFDTDQNTFEAWFTVRCER